MAEVVKSWENHGDATSEAWIKRVMEGIRATGMRSPYTLSWSVSRAERFDEVGLMSTINSDATHAEVRRALTLREDYLTRVVTAPWLKVRHSPVILDWELGESVLDRYMLYKVRAAFRSRGYDLVVKDLFWAVEGDRMVASGANRDSVLKALATEDAKDLSRYMVEELGDAAPNAALIKRPEGGWIRIFVREDTDGWKVWEIHQFSDGAFGPASAMRRKTFRNAVITARARAKTILAVTRYRLEFDHLPEIPVAAISVAKRRRMFKWIEGIAPASGSPFVML